jgi:hypothetical protein
MFFRDSQTEFKPPAVARSMALALALSVFGTFYLGILPGAVLEVLEKARDQIAVKMK